MSRPNDAWQPALLDRLQDDDRASAFEPAGRRHISPEQLLALVARDLERLMNASCVLERSVLDAMPNLKNCVLAYGMPALAGSSASLVNIRNFEQQLAELIRSFEPRIDPATLEVRAENQQGMMNLHNVIGLQIRGLLRGQPYPLELLLRQEVDLETGRVSLMPLSAVQS